MPGKRSRGKGSGTKSRAAKKTSAHRFAGISSRQLSLPAGFSADGAKLVPLRDVLSPDVPTMELSQLSQDQQADLTAERIRRQKRYRMGMVGFGVLDKKRAITEVKARTPVGQTLVEIEQRTLRMLIEKAKGKRGER